MTVGVLYGIGVGPGAPDLLTLRAAKILQTIDVILAPASSRNDYSLALKIAKPHLAQHTRIERLGFPMTHDQKERETAWQLAAETALKEMAKGQKVAFLTLGDPLLYSTFGYLLKLVRKLAPKAKIEIIPGIASFQAAAAKTQTILCEDQGRLAILPGIAKEADLSRWLANSDTAVILKVYRNHAAIAEALKQTGRANNCILASNVATEKEIISKGIPEQRPPYMSMLISKKPD